MAENMTGETFQINRRVTKDNQLIEAGFHATTNEMRLLHIAMSLIDSKRSNGPELVAVGMKIDAQEFAAVYKISLSHAYQALRQASNDLYEKDIQLNISNLDGRSGSKRLRWLSSIEYFEGEGRVQLFWTAEVIPYLTALRQRFTSYELRFISSLKNPYSLRIYELLKQVEGLGGRRLEIHQIKLILGLEKKYDRFSDFKKRVLDPAITEINAVTDLQASYETVRKGRTVTSIRFYVDKNQQELLDL